MGGELRHGQAEQNLVGERTVGTAEGVGEEALAPEPESIEQGQACVVAGVDEGDGLVHDWTDEHIDDGRDRFVRQPSTVVVGGDGDADLGSVGRVREHLGVHVADVHVVDMHVVAHVVVAPVAGVVVADGELAGMTRRPEGCACGRSDEGLGVGHRVREGPRLESGDDRIGPVRGQRRRVERGKSIDRQARGTQRPAGIGRGGHGESGSAGPRRPGQPGRAAPGALNATGPPPRPRGRRTLAPSGRGPIRCRVAGGSDVRPVATGG